jgi:glycosyltransferase involved in cell wall biosynthesis
MYAPSEVAEGRPVSRSSPARKVAVLVNVIAPYRVPVYEGIAERFQTHAFYAGVERNRAAWGEVPDGRGNLVIRRTAGLSIPYRTGDGQVYDERTLHLPLGHLVDLHRLRPDAVITTEMGLRTLLALVHGALRRVPVWIWWGGTLHTERGVGRVRRVVRRFLAGRRVRWISYGESSTEYLLTLGIPRARIVQIQNPVDESLYEIGERRRPGRPEPPVLLCVGQHIRRKGIDSLLRAAALVQAEGRDFVLRLVGEGPERVAFEQLAGELGLRGVEFLDARPPREMPEVYREADFLVFPTHEDVWGLVVNEALWSGLPVLSSIHAGCARELLPSERTFDPHDTEGFARVLRAAVDGEIGPADPSPLKRCREVSEMIASDIERVLEGRVG